MGEEDGVYGTVAWMRGDVEDGGQAPGVLRRPQ